MDLQVYSEIGPLREVITHHPGAEIDRMPPRLMEALLFDDILHGPKARQEHASFISVLEAAGVCNRDFRQLLRQAIETDGTRAASLVGTIAAHERLPQSVLDRLQDLSAEELCTALIEGMPASRESMNQQRFFDLNPLPNLLMARDPQVVLGRGLVGSAMRHPAREREALLSRFMFSTHPDFREAKHFFDFHDGSVGPKFGSLSLEGGDVLVLNEGIVLVGVSERTMEGAIDRLVEALRSNDEFRHMIIVRLPYGRSQMHLDTVFTRISESECLVFPPMLQEGYADTLSVVSVDLQSKTIDHGRRHPSFLTACRSVGLDLEPIPCGGDDDFIAQTREQWTDGANSFALAPGLIVLYERNIATLEALSAHDYNVVPAHEFTTDAGRICKAQKEGRKFVITIASAELSRARGGPRCMTMPLHRELF